jgi:hypothetical protein
MRFEAFSLGSSSDRRRHGRDLVIDHGEVCEPKKRASKKFRDSFGHKPVSMQEEIPWKCQRLVIGSGMGVLPVMMEVKGDAERHGIELVVLPTVESRRHQRHRAYDFPERSMGTPKPEAAK